MSDETGRTLVILDLNGTLVSTEYNDAQRRIESDFVVLHKGVHVRPFVNTFLNYMFSTYDVAIWTCNTRRYAEPIARKVLGRYYSRLEFMWTKADCSTDPTGRLVKNISTPKLAMWKRIVLVDDDPRKAGVHAATNLVSIRPFVPSTTELDSELLNVMEQIQAWERA